MEALSVFEELRFIIELVVAEQLFVWAFAERKRRFWPVFISGLIGLILIAISYPYLQSYVSSYNDVMLTRVVSISWYIFLVILTLIHIKLHYVISWSDVLFMGIAGYSVQHIEYVVVNEIIALGLWQDLPNHLFLYIMICIVTTAIWYYFIVKVFASKLKACNGQLYEDNIRNILFFLMMLIVLLNTAFLGQYLFINGLNNYDNINYFGATYDLFSSGLVLIVQYSIFRISNLNREKEIVKQLLYERQKQYKLSKENIDMINHKCHDLKHQIQALRKANSEDLEEYISDVEESIMIYDNVLKTENEVLNTILSEKSLYCEKHHIKLSCIIDANQLDFMGTQDIYVLLGNALDNAIESVIQNKDKDKRVISFTISANESFLSIQTNNFVEGNIKFEDGLPVTTKKNKAYHGYGMKSMKHLAEKYDGSMYTSQENEIFMLQIMIPIPAEFKGILNESQLEN